MDGFLRLRCLNNCIDLPDMIKSNVSAVTASYVAKKRTKILSQAFGEL